MRFSLLMFCAVLASAPSTSLLAQQKTKPWIEHVPTQKAASQASSTTSTNAISLKATPPDLNGGKTGGGGPRQQIIGGINAQGRFPNVGGIYGYDFSKRAPFLNGTGTLIHSRWVLTAAHVAQGCYNKGGAMGIELGGQIFWADLFVIAPNYGRSTAPLPWAPIGLPYGDLALIRLRTNVPSVIRPALIQTTPATVGQTLTIVGYGNTGSGQTGVQYPSDGVKRFGAVRIDAVGSDWTLWSFDRGETYSTSWGDSGGPQFNSSGAIVSITTGGNNKGIGYHGWGIICWNMRCDIHVPWMNSMMSRYTN